MAKNKKQYKIRFFEAKCNKCKNKFDMPLLSDFSSYGEFIVRNKTGSKFAYFETLTNSFWDEVSNIIDEIIRNKKNSRITIAKRQRVISKCLDKINDEQFAIDKPICPKCKSKDINYGIGHPKGVKRIPYVSFNEFDKMNKLEKVELVERILKNKLKTAPN